MKNGTTLNKKNLAQAQGEAFNEALNYVKDQAPSGQVKTAEYVITVAGEHAEGMYEFDGDILTWKKPTKQENQHIEVVVQNKSDLRFVPQLDVRVKTLDWMGDVIEDRKMPFIWHPFLYHYGANLQIPGEGDYIFHVIIKKPSFKRHDENEGKSFDDDTMVRIGPLHLKPGKKSH